MKIGLWGGSGSGKTSFLASLLYATQHNADGWTMTPASMADTATIDMVGEWLDTMSKGEFVPGTRRVPDMFSVVLQQNNVVPEQIHNHGPVAALRGRIRNAPIPVQQPPVFNLSVKDVPGELFDPERRNRRAESNEIISYFNECDGLLMLYNPLNLPANDRMFSFTSFLLQHSSTRFVAVCMTKIDDPVVLLNLENAESILKNVAEDRHFRIEGTAGKTIQAKSPGLMQALQNKFGNNLGFFLTSAIGFKSNANIGDFVNARRIEQRTESKPSQTADDFGSPEQSQEPKSTWEPRIIDGVRPINVLEPLIWLYEQSRV